MGSSDYEFDSDTPPTSPRLKPPRIPKWRRFYYEVRAVRGPLTFLISCLLLILWWSTRRKPLLGVKHEPSLYYKNVDWRMYAYSQYVADPNYLCSAVMAFDQLDQLGSKASRILMYPDHWDLKVDGPNDRRSQLLQRARKKYKVKLIPVKVEGIRTDVGANPDASELERMAADETQDTGITKFLTFNQTNFYRILHFDSDVTILKNMDDIFLAPEAQVAMPRAYWKLPNEKTLTSLFILLFPSKMETRRLIDSAERGTRADGIFDMEILNELYGDSAMVLPHRKYGLLSGEFRSKNHTNYHGNDYEEWHPQRALAEASIVHFSDYPLPKPWIMWHPDELRKYQPRCDYKPGTPDESGCRDRDVWHDLYRGFRKRRKDVCGLLSIPPHELPFASSIED